MSKLNSIIMKKTLIGLLFLVSNIAFSQNDVSNKPSSIISLDADLPLWELGFGGGGIRLPYYPGSDQMRTFAFPLVLPVYRGDLLKSDEDGLRAELLTTQNHKIDLSFDFNYKIDSEDVDARNGMDDIDSVFQFGPSFESKLYQSDNSLLISKFPVRAVTQISTDGTSSAGYTFAPNINYYRFLNIKQKPWRVGLSIGPQFSTSKYHAIYYNVDNEYATDQRSSYQADDGYSGYRFLTTFRSKNQKRLINFFIRYENLDGAVFEDSPLLKDSDSLTIGFLYSKSVVRSKKRVKKKNKLKW